MYQCLSIFINFADFVYYLRLLLVILMTLRMKDKEVNSIQQLQLAHVACFQCSTVGLLRIIHLMSLLTCNWQFFCRWPSCQWENWAVLLSYPSCCHPCSTGSCSKWGWQQSNWSHPGQSSPLGSTLPRKTNSLKMDDTADRRGCFQ